MNRIFKFSATFPQYKYTDCTTAVNNKYVSSDQRFLFSTVAKKKSNNSRKHTKVDKEEDVEIVISSDEEVGEMSTEFKSRSETNTASESDSDHESTSKSKILVWSLSLVIKG